MQDMKLVEALNDLRAEVRQGMGQMRRELRAELRDVRAHAIHEHMGLLRRLVWAVVVLGLALGGKDILALVIDVWH